MDIPSTSQETPSYVLVELTNLSELFSLTNIDRVKCTCITVSTHFFAIGTSSGSLHLFSRYAIKPKTQFTTPSIPRVSLRLSNNPVERICIARNELHLCAASRSSTVYMIAISPPNNGTIDASVQYNSNVHNGAQITEMISALDSRSFYVGDDKGIVSQCKCTRNLIFRSSSEVLFKSDSQIVQLDLRDGNWIAVSTLTRTQLYNLESNECITIGQTPRNDRHGALFCEKFGDMVIVARPNARLWECSWIDGTVFNTHKFNKNASQWLQMPIVTFEEDLIPSNLDMPTTEPFDFYKLHLVRCSNDEVFVVAYDRTRIVVIDLIRGRVVLIAHTRRQIVDLCTVRSDIFVLSSDGSLHKYTLLPYASAVEKLVHRRLFQQALRLCALYEMHDSERIPWSPEVLQNILRGIHELSTSALSQADLNAIEATTRLLHTAQAQLIAAERMRMTERMLGIERQSNGYRLPTPLRSRHHSEDLTPNASCKPSTQTSSVRRSKSEESVMTIKNELDPSMSRSTAAADSNISVPRIDAALRTLLSGKTKAPLLNEQLNKHDAEWLAHIDNLDSYLLNRKTKPLDDLPEVPIVLRKVTKSLYRQSNKRKLRCNKSTNNLARIATDNLNNSYTDMHMANSDSTVVNANLCLERVSEAKCSTCALDRHWLQIALFGRIAKDGNRFCKCAGDFEPFLQQPPSICDNCQRWFKANHSLDDTTQRTVEVRVAKERSIDAAMNVDRSTVNKIFDAQQYFEPERSTTINEAEIARIQETNDKLPYSVIVSVMRTVLGAENTLKQLRLHMHFLSSNAANWSEITKALLEEQQPQWQCLPTLADAIIEDRFHIKSPFPVESSSLVDKSTRSYSFRLNQTCPNCTLPIRTRVTSRAVKSENPTALYIFPCGHIFHRVCLRPSDNSPTNVQCVSCMKL